MSTSLGPKCLEVTPAAVVFAEHRSPAYEREREMLIYTSSACSASLREF